jgi:beta-glucosidase/6-phospho-beta-glucosidase/beta-galactosidase
VTPDLIGLNLYPMFSDKRVEPAAGGWRVRSRPGGADVLAALARLYWRRYRRPLLITETAARGSVGRRLAWLRQSVAAVRALRAAGVPLLGYTWWPLYSLVGWAYRERDGPLSRYWVDMGLWDLDRDADLARRRTPVADAYRQLVRAGDAAVGPLRPPRHAAAPGMARAGAAPRAPAR